MTDHFERVTAQYGFLDHYDLLDTFFNDPTSLLKKVTCVGREYDLFSYTNFRSKVPTVDEINDWGCFCCEQRGNPDVFLATYITHDGSDYNDPDNNSDTSYICPVCFNDGWRQHDFEDYEGPDAKPYINVNDPDYAKDVATKAARKAGLD
jgi:hypothetical protein